MRHYSTMERVTGEQPTLEPQGVKNTVDLEVLTHVSPLTEQMKIYIPRDFA